MKKSTIFLALTAVMMLFGCSSNDDGPLPREKDTLDVTPLTLFFNSGDYTAKEVTVTSNVEWNAIPNVEWITLNKNGNMLSVKVAEFRYGEETRVGAIAITAGEAEGQTVTVTQAPEMFEKPTLKIFPEKLEFGVKGGSEVVSVVSNVDWEVKSAPDWITYSVNQSTKEISIEAGINSKSEGLTGQLIISSPESVEDAVVAISQERLIFKASVVELKFPAEGGVKHVDIESNIDSWKVESLSTWFDVVSANVIDHDIEVTVQSGAAQGRSGSFSISIPGLDAAPIVVAVIQEETKFSATPLALSFTADGGEQIVKVETNLTAWEATGDGQTWIDFGVNIQEGELSVTVQKNQITSAKNAVITIKPIGSSVDNITITVAQEEGEEPQLPYIWSRPSAEYMNIKGNVVSVSYFSDFTYNEGIRVCRMTDMTFDSENYLQTYVHPTQTAKTINMAITYDGERRVTKIVGSGGGNFDIVFTYGVHGKHITAEELLLELSRQGGVGPASYALWMPRLIKNLESITLTDRGGSYNNARYEVKIDGAGGTISKFDNKGSETKNFMVLTFASDMITSMLYNRYPNDYEAKYNINPISGVIDTKILLNKTASTISTYRYMDNVHNRLLEISGGSDANEFTYNEQFDLTVIKTSGVTYDYIYNSNNHWTKRTSSGGETIDRIIVYR